MERPSNRLIFMVLNVVKNPTYNIKSLTINFLQSSIVGDATRNELLYCTYWLEFHGFIERDKNNTHQKYYSMTKQGDYLLEKIKHELS
ncbi:DUF3116 family protein [Listeria ivanovii]|uniref:DUF3116 family protein n=1 Tax=Listeria ivanovii TaxID=1638 RepID=UPI0005127D30|nr:DUF3116 family protein [Listeria ivanovii]AIS62478.1 hypothetical protein JL53_07000 [Listeria ivanovii subsp. londoniensis]MBK1965058.1 DUF3116 family protein [Listeria ivanovii subsp. londoniensis]MBK1984578.1 DUF3116 family protein [Listeria ivanovii subsp. londoniensis]MBK1995660.1 DUF3116 family protein [Listeria ivanovii subsp. londoniensis]PZG31258.1 DUF3116 domain-containing protein [Listeria ivanovii]